jgi:hypothetical protein
LLGLGHLEAGLANVRRCDGGVARGEAERVAETTI